MKTAGIVSEFNPFHNGHKYLIDSVREQLAPDAVVCIMSGNFVQRGGPAVLDKWVRARMAVACGADLVLELPTVYAVSGAPTFAAGGVAVMKGLGLDAIAFGSESGDVISLEGKLCDGVTPIDMKNSPNDLLALEYMKQNWLQGAGLEEFTVERLGAGHDSLTLKNGGKSASASLIRKMLTEGCKPADLADFMPYKALEMLEDAGCFDCRRQAEGDCSNENLQQRWFDLVRYCLLTKSPGEIAALPGAYGGIEYRLKEAAVHASSLDELILTAKARRYAYAGLSRLLTCMVLGIGSGEMALTGCRKGLSALAGCKTGGSAEYSEPLVYARVLAFNDMGAALLKALRKTASIPVVTNVGKNLAEDARERLLLDVDARAADLYSILAARSIYENSDYVLHP